MEGEKEGSHISDLYIHSKHVSNFPMPENLERGVFSSELFPLHCNMSPWLLLLRHRVRRISEPVRVFFFLGGLGVRRCHSLLHEPNSGAGSIQRI